eukprot:g1981.t1
MGYVRSIDRSAVVTFSPIAPYYLAGSAASAIDLNFSTASVLEVFKVDFTTPPPTLPIAGAPITIGERFHSVSWGKTGAETKLHPLGLVAGGLEDGSVSLWDPNRIIQGSEANRCIVAKLRKHNNAVRALDFNPNLTQYLATGAMEPDLAIWDLTKPSIPITLTTPVLTAPGSGMEGEFTCTKWNEKVHQILASCTTSGKTIVQDIRRAKPVATLHDLNSSRRCSVLEWSPERPTQVLVASEDDRTPSVQVWDLRNSASPLSELAGHSKGILSMSWSPHDARLLLTCAKDSKTYCWNAQTSQIIAELPPLGAWHLHVQWSPITPGLFSVSSFDGKVGLCSFGSMIGPLSADGVSRDSISVVPKWLQRPSGLSYGFGGKLVHVMNSEKQIQDPSSGVMTKMKSASIHVKQLKTEAEAIPQSTDFSQAMKSGDRDRVLEYCKMKTMSLGSGKEQEVWKMLGLMFSDDAKHQLLIHLGFADVVDLLKTEPVVENGSGKQEEVKTALISEGSHQDSGINAALDFFDNLGDEVPSPKKETKPVAIPEEKPTKPESISGVNEAEIQKALLVRNFDGAIDACWKGNRSADALLIAHVAGPTTFEREMQKYMSLSPSPFMPLLSAIAASDFRKLVSMRDVAQWKETLAMLVAYVEDPVSWSELCDTLGLALYKSGDYHGASICFICSGNVEKAVGVWSGDQNTSSGLQTMQAIIEKAFVLSFAIPQNSSSQSLSNLVHNYAQILASYGDITGALEYLDMVPGGGDSTENIQILKDRIYGSGMAGDQVIPHQGVQKMSSNSWTPPMQSHEFGESPGFHHYQTPEQSVAAPPPPQQYGMSYPHHQETQNPPFQSTGVQQFAPMPSMFTPQAPGDYNRGQSAGEGKIFQPIEPPSQFGPPQVTGMHLGAQQGPPQGAFTPNAAPLGPPQGAFVPAPVPQVPTQGAFAPTPVQQGPPQGAFAPNPVQQGPPQGAFVPTPVQPGSFLPTPGAVSSPMTTRQHVFNPVAPVMSAQQPGSPMKTPAPVPVEESPPHDVTALNADTSQIAPQYKAIVTHLQALFTRMESSNVAPSQRRIVVDASKRVGWLFWYLNKGKVKDVVAQKVLKYAQALVSGDMQTASKVLDDLTETAWDEVSSHWLSSFKRLIKLAQTIK